MIWNLPIHVRLAILFVLLPILDRIYVFLVGSPLLTVYVVRQLERFNRLWYVYGWFLMFRSMLFVVSMYVGEYFSNFTYVDQVDYVWFWTMTGCFCMGFLLTLFHGWYASRVTKVIAIIGILGGFIVNICYIYDMYLLHGFEYFSRRDVQDLLMAIGIVYRFKIESVIRL